MSLLIEVVGWIGAVLVLGAYGLLTMGKLRSMSWSYQLMNLFGSTGLAVNGFWNGAFPSVGLNLIWMGIGIFALTKLTMSLRSSSSR